MGSEVFFSRELLSNTFKAASIVPACITAVNGVFELFGEHTDTYKYPVGIVAAAGFFAIGKLIEPGQSE